MRPVRPKIVDSLTQVGKCDPSSRPMVAGEWLCAAKVSKLAAAPSLFRSLLSFSTCEINALRKSNMYMDGSIGSRTLQSVNIQQKESDVLVLYGSSPYGGQRPADAGY